MCHLGREEGEFRVWCYLWLWTGFEYSLDFVRFCLRKKIANNNQIVTFKILWRQKIIMVFNINKTTEWHCNQIDLKKNVIYSYFKVIYFCVWSNCWKIMLMRKILVTASVSSQVCKRSTLHKLQFIRRCCLISNAILTVGLWPQLVLTGLQW